MNGPKTLARLVPLLVALLPGLTLPGPAAAQTAAAAATDEATTPVLSLSTFATLGWAASNRSWRYQRHLDRQGSLRRDSLLGAQLDAEWSPSLSATWQLRLASDDAADHHSRLRTSWAFVAWRHDNDWLLRLGRLRAPFFLRSQQLDVGATYDALRLPGEVYGLAPSNDFDGWHLQRSLDGGDGEWLLEAYRGRARIHKRDWLRQALPPLAPAGAHFQPLDLVAQGLVLSWNDRLSRARLGLHRSEARPADGRAVLVEPVWAPLGAQLGYWQTSTELPGPGVATVRSFRNDILTLGGDTRALPGWRFGGELLRIRQRDIRMGLAVWSGYLGMAREWGRLTPYLIHARAHSTDPSQAWTARLDGSALPQALPAAAALNGSMQAAADLTQNYRQYSWATGLAWTPTPGHKLKAEWLHTRARHSSMFDLPAGAALVQPRTVEVWSLSYSLVH